ncbi:CoA-binding protein [Flavobacterium silvaticum]|uniref:CoA-binding protein n=1 Tax=Flavobacterium silvaticum TaxID=1852020 RepID=A0A972JGY5_9FLAO|nr:CoA-binding protein [Flavobacterium silvaticum]NMH29534.1 CoA-binding protein [Flavobacterium silvaticum]
MSKKTLVLGASENPMRYSNLAINSLVHRGHEVAAVGLRKGEVAGIEIHNSKQDFDGIDTVTLYMNPKNQEPYYDYIIGLAPNRVIFNPGTENPELIRRLRENNIEIEVACTLVMLSTNQY